LSRHHKAFLGAFKQMMVAVFGPGMEQAFSKAPIQAGTVELGESSSRPPLRSQPIQPPPQSARSQAFQPPPQGTGGQPVQPPQQASGTANPATTAGQHGSTCATAESVPAYVRRDSVRLAWGPACLRPQDCSGKQLAAEEPIRRRLPRGGKLRSH
jgi:type IV secretory pathway VirB10-like protein